MRSTNLSTATSEQAQALQALCGCGSVEQMDGLELSAPSDAQGKLLSQSLGRELKLLAEGMGLGSPGCIMDLLASRQPQLHGPTGQ